VTYQYDAGGNLGNLTHESDISTLASASMSYSTTARPHALTTLNTGSATRTFTYNANGSMTGFTYDVLGRLSQVKYPTTTSCAGANRHTATYSWDACG
jgi:hypothetical protein